MSKSVNTCKYLFEKYIRLVCYNLIYGDPFLIPYVIQNVRKFHEWDPFNTGQKTESSYDSIMCAQCYRKVFLVNQNQFLFYIFQHYFLWLHNGKPDCLAHHR